MNKTIYLNYSREDLDLARSFSEELREYIGNCNIILEDDADLESIIESDIVLCLLSDNFGSSPEAIQELTHASNLNKKIIGVSFSKVEPSKVKNNLSGLNISESIRSGCFLWITPADKDFLLKQIYSFLGMESPLGNFYGTLVEINVVSKCDVCYDIDGEKGLFPKDQRMKLRFLPGDHRIFVQSSKFIYCSVSNTLTIRENSVSKHLYFDLDDLLDELGEEKNIIDKNGNQYTGWVVKGRYDGHGVYTTPDGFLYDGAFQNGQPQSCLLEDAAGNKYTGQFKNWKRHGEGKQIWSNGNMYEGTWENDIPNGAGFLVTPDGTTYEGIFVNGEINEGVITYRCGDRYEGGIKNLKRHGIGKLQFKVGKILEGIWEDDTFQNPKTYPTTLRQKKCKVKEPVACIACINGDESDLLFQDGYFHDETWELYTGKGKCTWQEEGIYFEGMFAGGVISSGCFFTSDGAAIVEGEIVEGLFSCKTDYFPLWEQFVPTVFETFVTNKGSKQEECIQQQGQKETVALDSLILQKNEQVLENIFDSVLEGESTRIWEEEGILFRGLYHKGTQVSGCFYFETENTPIVSGHWDNGIFFADEEFFPNWREFIEDLQWD